MENLLPIGIGVLGLIIGFIVGKMISGNKAKEIELAATKDAQLILSKAESESENLKNTKILEAKEYFLKSVPNGTKKKNVEKKSIRNVKIK